MREYFLQTRELSIGYRSGARKSLPWKVSPHPVAKIIAEDIELELGAGELICLLGPNGSGKSTLMRTLAGVQKPLGGSVLLKGSDVGRLHPKETAKLLSLVLTERVTTGNMSVYALVALGRYPYTGWMGKLAPEDEVIVRHAIETTGTSRFAHRHIGDLSDGERQKVMIARAIAQDTPIILLDEPTAHLDLPNRLEIIRLLKTLAMEQRKAVVLSTHELDLALQAADRIWLMNPSGGSASAMVSAIPESLVLDGHLEHAFTRNGFEFDSHSGSFRFRHEGGHPVGLIGEGVPAYWTQRALERAGYRVVHGASDIRHVEIETRNGKRNWMYVSGEGCQPVEKGSLDELLLLVSESQNEGKA
ncbi:MAG: ABC transporter ATP-binding protein [Chlorobiaceae bacterium]|jgi:iron complex transport system ATP-binding protein|nr:ABC transporter ATP-binding protein [Chlorobiaceae bacterium]